MCLQHSHVESKAFTSKLLPQTKTIFSSAQFCVLPGQSTSVGFQDNEYPTDTATCRKYQAIQINETEMLNIN